jgi:signal transduction histidine kinase
MRSVHARLERARQHADPDRAAIRALALSVGLAVFASLQVALLPDRVGEPGLEVAVVAGFVLLGLSGFALTAFLSDAPGIHHPMALSLVLLSVRGTNAVIGSVVVQPAWTALLFEDLAMLIAIGALVLGVARWAEVRDERERTLRERERTLQRQNRRLEEFADVVSHDLRNPLQIATHTVTAARSDLDPNTADRLTDALDRMETIIEDVLALSRVGADAVDAERVDLEHAAAGAWQTVATPGAALDIRDTMALEADPGLFAQLFENCYRNAIEHGGGDVTVSVGTIDRAGEGDRPVGFYVADDGPGIPPEERDEVLSSGYSGADGGTGFGLAIVARIAEAHDWAVEVTESEAGGARFEFRPASL